MCSYDFNNMEGLTRCIHCQIIHSRSNIIVIEEGVIGSSRGDDPRDLINGEVFTVTNGVPHHSILIAISVCCTYLPVQCLGLACMFSGGGLTYRYHFHTSC